MATQSARFIRVTAARTRDDLPVVLLLGRNLPSTPDVSPHEQLSTLPPGPFALVYLHADVPATTFWGVRTFRRAYDAVPREIRQRISRLVALHVSFTTRAQVYANSSWLEFAEFAKLEYCDLIVDLERTLGIDALLTGLEDTDVRYDAIMRSWVARDDEIRPVRAPDPAAAQFSWDNIDFSIGDRKPDRPTASVYSLADDV